MASSTYELTTTPDRDMACQYCRSPMLRVLVGWHCPTCHASVGDPDAGRT